VGFESVKDARGRVVGVIFKATLKMHRVVLEFKREENKNLTNAEILKKCNVSEAEYDSWWRNFVVVKQDQDGKVTDSTNYFEIWFDEAMQIKSGIERELLWQTGMFKALNGEFNFWQACAKTVGAISPEQVNHTHTVIPFNLKEGATSEEIADFKRKVLESQRTMDNARGGGMVRLTSKRSKS